MRYRAEGGLIWQKSLLKLSCLLLYWRKNHWLEAEGSSHNEPETIRHRLQQDVKNRNTCKLGWNQAQLFRLQHNMDICMRSRVWKPCERPPAQQTKLLQTLALNNFSLFFRSNFTVSVFRACNTLHLVLTSPFVFYPFASLKYRNLCTLWNLPFQRVQIQFVWNHSIKDLTVQLLWTELKHLNKINACMQYFLGLARQSAYIQ